MTYEEYKKYILVEGSDEDDDEETESYVDFPCTKAWRDHIERYRKGERS